MRSEKNINGKYLKRQSFKPAFTIIELIVVIAIIAILAAITFVSYSSWRQTTTVAQLKSDLSGAASAMENYRTFNNLYPVDVTTLSTFTPSSGVTVNGGSSDGGLTYCVSAVNSQFPSLPYHIDSTLTGNNAQPGICLNQRTLTTIAGAGGTVTPPSGPFNYNSVQTITATPYTNFAFSGWTGTASDCYTPNTASHSVTMDTNKTCTANFVVTGYVLTYTAGLNGSITGTSPQVVSPGGNGAAVTAVPATYYSFNNWSDSSSANPRTDTNVNTNISVTANFTPTPIAAPTAPTVAVSQPDGSHTQWSWGPTACGSNTVRYQYDYTVNSTPTPYDSGWIAMAGSDPSPSSQTFLTSTTGLTYTLTVQAQCYNAATTSSWSASGSASYYSPIPCAGGTGGTVTYLDSNGLNSRSSPKYTGGYTVNTFTSSGTFTSNGVCTVTLLVVAGGGGGGATEGGAGGAGGVVSTTFGVTAGAYTVSVGNGGAGQITTTTAAQNGGNSAFGTVIATGGGNGGGWIWPAGSGGSGGGGASGNGAGGSGTSGQGYSGGVGFMDSGNNREGGGGGGAGGAAIVSVQNKAGNGGPGVASSITGTSTYYGGGGGGCYEYGSNAWQGAGGVGGGGHGGDTQYVYYSPTAGTTNTGGGAGCEADNIASLSGMAGGSGIVIVRYLSP